MKANSLIFKLIDKNIIGTEIYTENKEDHILFRMKRSPYSVKIPLKITSNIGYLIGVIMGDGNISFTLRKNCKYPRTKITIYNNSMDYLESLNKIIQNEFGITGIIWKKKYNNCYVLGLNNKIIISYFVKFIGLFPSKKIYLKLPKSIRQKEIFKHYLSGLIDTDGFFTNNTFGIMMNGTNYNFLRNIRNIAYNYYKIEFRKPAISKIHARGKEFIRAAMSLSTHSKQNFLNTIELRHERWVRPELNQGLRLVRASFVR